MAKAAKANLQLESVSELRGSFPEVPLAMGVNYDALVEADLAKGQQPMFVTLPLAQFGQVSRNKRRYSEAEVRRIHQRINEGQVTGILGHLTFEQRSSAFPEVVVKWVGAAIEGNQLWGKLYVLSNSEYLREYFRVQKATGGRVGTSLYGMAFEEYNPDDDVWDVNDLEIEQIDIVHPDRVGVMFAATMTPHLTNETIQEAENGDLAVDDFVRFERDGVLCFGSINTIWTEGEVEVPYQDGLTVTATEEDPIARLNVWHPSYERAGWIMSDWQVLQHFSTLTKIEPLPAAETINPESEDDTEAAEMATKSNTPTQEGQEDVDSRILALQESHQGEVRELNLRVKTLEAQSRTFTRLLDMLEVKEGQDPVLALQAKLSTMKSLEDENINLLETAIQQEVGKHVKVDWAKGVVEQKVRERKPLSRAEVVSFTQEALVDPHIAVIVKNATVQAMGPNVETTKTQQGEGNQGNASDVLILIPGMGMEV